MVATGLFATARLWAPLQTAQNWLVRAGHILANEEQSDAAGVEAQYRELLEEVLTAKSDEAVAAWATTFYKVTRSYWPGLFHCYEMEEVPRTNNDLEQYFGKARHHERRATGHKRPSAAVAVRGSVRVVAAVATQATDEVEAAELRPRDLAAWRAVRAQLETRQERHRAGRRFRKDPAAYLARLEQQLLHLGLPA